MTRTEEAIKAIKRAGGPLVVAEAMGLSFQAVYKWQKTGIPAGRVKRFCELTGAKVEKLL